MRSNDSPDNMGHTLLLILFDLINFFKGLFDHSTCQFGTSVFVKRPLVIEASCPVQVGTVFITSAIHELPQGQSHSMGFFFQKLADLTDIVRLIVFGPGTAETVMTTGKTFS